MNLRSIASVLFAFMMFLAMPACGDNAVDKYLDEYEKFVVTAEKLAKKDTITQEDSEMFAKQAQEYTVKGQELAKTNAKFSDKQTKKMQDLLDRVAKAMQEIQKKNWGQ